LIKKLINSFDVDLFLLFKLKNIGQKHIYGHNHALQPSIHVKAHSSFSNTTRAHIQHIHHKSKKDY